MTSDPLIASLSAAVEASPGDVALRLHLADLLLQHGDVDEAVRHAAIVLQSEPTNPLALEIVDRARPAVRGSADEERRGSRAAANDDPDDVIGRLEEQLFDVVPPMFVESSVPRPGAYEVEDAGVRLDDVGGMKDVKDRLEASFLAPLRNPDLVRLYGKSLRGGLLLYGRRDAGRPSSRARSQARWARASSRCRSPTSSRR